MSFSNALYDVIRTARAALDAETALDWLRQYGTREDQKSIGVFATLAWAGSCNGAKEALAYFNRAAAEHIDVIAARAFELALADLEAGKACLPELSKNGD